MLRVSKYKSKLDRYSTRESINLCLLVYYLSCPAHLDKFHFGSRTAWKIMEMAFLAAKSRHCLGCEENKNLLQSHLIRKHCAVPFTLRINLTV